MHVGEILRRSPKFTIHARDLLALSIQSRDQQRRGIGGDVSGSSAYKNTNEAAVILPRAGAVLVNMGHVKAISWREEAFLFDR